MNATIEDTLLNLFQQVTDSLEKLPGLVEISLPLIRVGGKRHVQGVNLRKDGSAFPVDLHQSVFTYQGKPHMLSMANLGGAFEIDSEQGKGTYIRVCIPGSI